MKNKFKNKKINFNDYIEFYKNSEKYEEFIESEYYNTKIKPLAEKSKKERLLKDQEEF